VAVDLLLLHPPATKPGEAPLGVAVLAGHLRAAGHAVAVLDANLGAYLHLLDPERAAAAAGAEPTTALRRALRHGAASLDLLRSPAGGDFARYSTAVHHLQTLLTCYGAPGERLTLGDYEHPHLSPYRPADLAGLAAGTEATLFADYFHTVLVPRVAVLAPKRIALSINYRHQVLPAFELAWMLARALPGVELIAGGGMITSWRPMLEPAAGALPPFARLIFGPGEAPLATLLAGRAGAGELLSGTTTAFAPDFADLPLADYLAPQPVLPLAASRGCYWGRCRFCPEAATPTHPYAAPSGDALVDLLIELRHRYGVSHFHLTDNAIPVPNLRALARRAAELEGIAWHGFVRFEAALLDAQLLAGLRRSGCTLLQLGLESGAQTVLERMVKGTELTTAAALLVALQQAGIATYVYVMLGTPGESEAEVAATEEFLLAHASRIGFLNLALMNLPRASDLAPEQELLDVEAPLGLYRSSAGPERAAARRALTRLQQHPPIRAILRRTPPYFTSNHAFFFPPPGCG
jgi:hypothetical protein